MNDNQISEHIVWLDKEVPRDGAKVMMVQYGGGPDEGKIIANRTGFLRLGIELAKGDVLPTMDDNSMHVGVDINYLIGSGSTIRFDWFERREDVTEVQPTGVQRLGGWSCAILLLGACALVAVLALIGLVAIAKFFMS